MLLVSVFASCSSSCFLEAIHDTLKKTICFNMQDESSPRPVLDFDIDHYINPFIPRSRLYRLPRTVSRFLGYRATPSSRTGRILVCIWAFIGTFCGLAIIEAVFRSEALRKHGTPVVVASLVSAFPCFQRSLIALGLIWQV